jgi:hypothetical protein
VAADLFLHPLRTDIPSMYLAPMFLAAWLAAAAGGTESAKPSDRPKPNVDPVQAELDRVANLELPRQQAWLRQLERRADEAAQATLAPQAAAEEQERIYRLLHQKRVTFAALRQLLEETLRREGAAGPVEEADTPAATTTPFARGSERATPSAATTPSARGSGHAAPPAEPVEVNVEELAARIAGSNLAFREMEAALDEKGPWHAARLGPLVGRAEILVLRRGDLQLLRNLVPEPDRDTLVRLESPKATIAELGARIAEARTRAGGAEFTGTEEERRAELKGLGSLAKRLAKMAK